MSDPARVEALVQAECAATGAVVRKSRRGGGGGGSTNSNATKVPKPSGTYEVSRAVQRAAPPASTSAPSSLANDDDAEGLRRAAVHHWRARMMVKLSSLYADAAWDAQEKPRKFFIKHRGFGPTHGRGDLPHHRRMFLRCALASAERASELAPSSLECATLRACILSLANAEDGADAADAALSRACAACRHAIRLHERWAGDASRETFEVSVLHSPGGGSDAGHGVGSGAPSSAHQAPPPAGASGSAARRIESLRSMATYAAHVLADRRGGWDFETSWVRETGDEWIDEEAEKAAKRVAAVILDDDDDDEDGEDDEDDDEDDDDEDAGGGWDMWQSPSILDYSLAALRGPP